MTRLTIYMCHQYYEQSIDHVFHGSSLHFAFYCVTLIFLRIYIAFIMFSFQLGYDPIKLMSHVKVMDGIWKNTFPHTFFFFLNLRNCIQMPSMICFTHGVNSM